MHTGALETGSYGNFASRFKDAGRGAEALFVKLWIPHAAAIAKEVKSASGGIGAVSDMRTERTDNGAKFAVVQFCATRCCPLFGLFAG